METVILYLLCGIIGAISITLVFWFSSEKRVAESVERTMSSDLTADDLMAAHARTKMSLNVLAVGAYIFTFGFAVTYFSGREVHEFLDFTPENWVMVAAGAIIVGGVTLFQMTLYQSTASLSGAAFAVLAVLVFVYISEVSTSMERSDALMTHRSENSKAVGVAERIAMTLAGKTSDQPYVDKIAKAREKQAFHQAEFDVCRKKHAARGELRIEKCERYEKLRVEKYRGKAESLENQQKSKQSSSMTAASAAIVSVDKFSRNEENYMASIRQLAATFGLSALAASTVLAFFFVNAFEVAFHAIGVHLATLSSALGRHGVNLNEGRVARRRQRVQERSETEAVRAVKRGGRRTVGVQREAKQQAEKTRKLFGGSRAARQQTSVGSSASSPATAQRSMSQPAAKQPNPGIGFLSDISTPTRQKKTPDRAGVLKAVDGIDVPRMIQARNQVASGQNGDEVACPVCGTVFTKRGAKIFCSSKGRGNCADQYRSLVRSAK